MSPLQNLRKYENAIKFPSAMKKPLILIWNEGFYS